MHPDEVTLGELVDGTLPAGERGEVERHVASCDQCRATITALADVRDAARALPPLTPPEGAWPRIERAIHREPARRDRPAGWMAATRAHWPWLAAAAVLLVVTAVGLRTWSRPAVPAGQANAAPAAAQTAATADADSAAAAAVVEAELQA